MSGIFWVEESNDKAPISMKRKRRVGKRKLEFYEWGSKPLIEFLEAIGQDTIKKHSRQEITVFISKYINEKGLASAEKKKKVICDERLFALFGKKSIPRTKVFDLLEEHFVENHDDSDDDELFSSEDEDHVEKKSKSKYAGQMKKVPEPRKSCFAAITVENLKLVYLRKSLIQEFLKVPESFVCKVVGSFVKMKCDRRDIYQKNRFQIHLVTGVEGVPGDSGAGDEILLKLSNFFKSVPISVLGDGIICEEEVEELRERIKAGSLNRLTVNELEFKAQMLHVDITKHWIPKELSMLQNQIDHYNEKGWRDEMFKCIERRKMLQTPLEVEKLLLHCPTVIAEELEPEIEVTVPDPSENAEGSGCSPTSIFREDSNVSSTDVSGSGEFVTPPSVIFNDAHALEVQNEGMEGVGPCQNANGFGGFETAPTVISNDACAPKVQNRGINSIMSHMDPNVISNDACGPKVQNRGIDSIMSHMDLNEAQPVDFINHQGLQFTDVNYDGSSRREMPYLNFIEAGPQGKPEELAAVTPAIIDLSDDDSEDEDPKGEDRNDGEHLDPNDVIWYYLDPQGQTRGPFSLYSLKKWYDANYFHPGFTVWRSGQTSNEMLLVDIFRRIFPC